MVIWLERDRIELHDIETTESFAERDTSYYLWFTDIVQVRAACAPAEITPEPWFISPDGYIWSDPPGERIVVRNRKMERDIAFPVENAPLVAEIIERRIRRFYQRGAPG